MYRNPRYCERGSGECVVSKVVVESMTNLTSLDTDNYPMCGSGVHLETLWQLQELNLGFLNELPILISDAASLTSLSTAITTLSKSQRPKPSWKSESFQ
jgi:hypothetical protein